MLTIDSKHIQSIDNRRNIAIPGDWEETVRFAADYWIETAQRSIETRGRFAVALSGGTTPNAIYQMLSSPFYVKQLDWSKVCLFWSDERSVAPEDPQSNFHSAMIHGIMQLPLSEDQIFRMAGEKELSRSADEYEALIRKILGSSLFDLVMLGVGEDGHTASLFPDTEALVAHDRLVVPNHIPDKMTWRLTLTVECINQSSLAIIYAFGSAKQSIVRDCLTAPAISSWPASRIGTTDRKALWIIDYNAAQQLLTV
jgi:6-phosphogluconolactonase